jgi:hypothetical protein
VPRGGKLPGAGRKRERGDAVRAVTVRLTEAEDAALTALEVRWRVSGSEALRRALLSCPVDDG